MTAGGVVALELIIDVRRRAELLFQAIGAHQRRRAEHFIKITDLVGNGDERRRVVQLLLGQLAAEHAAELFKRHGLAGSGVEQGSGLVFHVRADVVPCLRHLRFFQIDLVRDFHVVVLLSNSLGEDIKNSCPSSFAGTGVKVIPAVPPGLLHCSHLARTDMR